MKKESLKQQAYIIIKSKIMSCEYMPNTFLNENMLQEEIKASRTPIREALSRLEQENLIKIIPKKGIMISELSVNEINMIYETRILIDPYVIRVYGSEIHRGALREIRRYFTGEVSTPSENLYQIDDDFHGIIYKPCKNKYLLQALEQMHIQNCRVRVLSGNVDFRLSQTQEEHLIITDYLLRDDYEKAAQSIIIHLQNAQAAAFSLLLDNGGWVSPSLEKDID